MNWLKFLHIVGATVCIGGCATMILVGIRARRSTDPSGIVEFGRVVQYVGMRLLGRAWIVVLITGAWIVLVSAALVSRWIVGYGLVMAALLVAVGTWSSSRAWLN